MSFMENYPNIKAVIQASTRVVHSDFEIKQLTSGYINQTYWVRNNGEQLILQKLNSEVFKNLEDINQNVLKLGNHLKNKDYPFQILELTVFENGNYLFEDEWRMFKYVEKTQTFLKVQSSKQAFEAAKFLSNFHAHLSDFKLDDIHDSIEGFLDFGKRLNKYNSALENANEDRKNRAEETILFLEENKSILLNWLELLPQLPIRIIHADPKVSNFLFDENDANKVVALIDWDTILRGSILYDFGDMVRSYTNLKEEDDPTFGDNFSLENYRALEEGFLFHLKDKLTEKEVENLTLGAKVAIYVQAIRFLTDYLNGDVYYSISYPEQNLNRAIGQVNLLRELKETLR